jgi:hypothetical protein
MDLDVVFSEADLYKIHQQVDADDYAISRASGLVVIELSFRGRARPGTDRVRLRPRNLPQLLFPVVLSDPPFGTAVVETDQTPIAS